MNYSVNQKSNKDPVSNTLRKLKNYARGVEWATEANTNTFLHVNDVNQIKQKYRKDIRAVH